MRVKVFLSEYPKHLCLLVNKIVCMSKKTEQFHIINLIFFQLKLKAQLQNLIYLMKIDEKNLSMYTMRKTTNRPTEKSN